MGLGSMEGRMRTLERLRASASCGPIRAGTKAKTSNLPRFRSDQVPLVAREAVPHDEEHLERELLVD